MSRDWRRVGALAAAIAVTVLVAPTGSAAAAPTQPGPAVTTPGVCDQYAGDPDPGTPAWTERDVNDVGCSYQRYLDALASPAFLAKQAAEVAIATQEFVTVTAPAWAAEPTRIHANCCTVPAAKVGDPFRNPDEWAASRGGRELHFSFINRNGAKLAARLYAPAAAGPYPSIVFVPGLQSYNEVNEWFAEGMAEAGYLVLIIDPQGQGDSESCGHQPDGTTTTCPATDQPDDTRSAIDFILSTPSAPYPWALGMNAVGTPTFNPWWSSVDAAHLGIAGHSLGAIAVTPIGQQDPRVSAVVSYDNLDATLAADITPRTPTLYFGTDYAFPATGTPKLSAPDPAQHLNTAYEQLRAAGVDTMSVTTRASDHYDFGYQPFPADLPSSRLGERVDFYYSLAWFDRYLRNDPTAVGRLTAATFDGSSDAHSIGAGVYDAARAAADPSDPYAGNVPYQIAGDCVANLLSFYFTSAVSIADAPVGDLRARGCPAAAGAEPAIPPVAGAPAAGSTLPRTGRTAPLLTVLALLTAGLAARFCRVPRT